MEMERAIQIVLSLGFEEDDGVCDMILDAEIGEENYFGYWRELDEEAKLAGLVQSVMLYREQYHPHEVMLKVHTEEDGDDFDLTNMSEEKLHRIFTQSIWSDFDHENDVQWQN